MLDDLKKDWNGTKSFFSRIPVKVGVGLLFWWFVYLFVVEQDEKAEKRRLHAIESNKVGTKILYERKHYHDKYVTDFDDLSDSDKNSLYRENEESSKRALANRRYLEND